jgi:hypothetical protein
MVIAKESHAEIQAYLIAYKISFQIAYVYPSAGELYIFSKNRA